MVNIKGVSIGEKVYWVDPDNGISNGWYAVVKVDEAENNIDLEKIKADEDFSWEDAIICIENEYSYAEVYLNELRFGKSKLVRKFA